MREQTPLVLKTVNPLRGALAHYEASLASTFQTLGATVTSMGVTEPSVGEHGKLSWIAHYERAVHVPSGAGEHCLVLWPTLGYLDLAVAAIGRRSSPVSVIVHDPNPMVRAIGHGRWWRAAAVRSPWRARVVVHTTQALADLPAGLECDLVPHPMAHPTPAPPFHGRPAVRVLGQYKRDRDLQSLERLAQDLPSAWRLEIVGRGWPPVTGWTVRDDYVDEGTFDTLVRTSSVVLIPYRHFYQSGVALRALELGIPVVGPRDSSLSELLGRDSRWLVDESNWSEAVGFAVADRQCGLAAAAAERAYELALAGWRDWLRSAT